MRHRRVDLWVKPRPGSLYHTVERLESQGLIEVVDTQHQRKSELDWTKKLVADLESGRIPWPDGTKPDDLPPLPMAANQEVSDDKAS